MCKFRNRSFFGKEFICPPGAYSRDLIAAQIVAILLLNYYLILANSSWKRHRARRRVILTFKAETLLSAETSPSSHALLIFMG